MTTTITSRAQVATAKPVPYIRQPCKHFGHVIASHLERFGKRYELSVDWTR